MKNKYLFTVTDENLIDTLKDKGITNLVFPLDFFCVGIPKTFKINEITYENAYLLINRVLDCDAIKKLDALLHNLPSNIKGIIFDDLGIIEITKDLNLHKVLFLSHFTTNKESINYFFDYVDDIIISTDICEEEIDYIIKNAKKKVSLYTFGLVSAMYSRRMLLTSHAMHHQTKKEEIKELTCANHKFIMVENTFGSVLYNYPYYNATRLLKKDAAYYFYFPLFLDKEDIEKLIDNDLSFIKYDYGFLDTKTIYKVKKERKD